MVPSSKMIKKELASDIKLSAVSDTPLLSVKNLSKCYSKRVGYAIKDVSFEVRKGQIHAFVGANGAGKTTTIKCIVDAYKNWEGEILISGLSNNLPKAKLRIAYLPEEPIFPKNLRVDSYLFSFAVMLGVKRKDRLRCVEEVLRELSLNNIRSRKLDKLSSGQKRKVFLAQSLVSDPDLFIMDEPTANLDPRARMEFFDFIKRLQEKGKSFFISTHVLKEIDDYANYVTILDEGRVLYTGFKKEGEDLQDKYFKSISLKDSVAEE